MKITKLIALALVICFMTCAALGCFPNANPTVSPVVTGSPQIGTTASPEPTQALKNTALADLDYDMFKADIASSLYSYLTMIKNPANFNDIPKPTELWGELSLDAAKQAAAEDKAFLERLNELEPQRAAMNDADRLTFDTLKQYLETAVESVDYYYYDEPLSPFNGMHTMLPLTMAILEIGSKERAYDYLLLLEDIPRVIGEILAFETEKSQKGLFMREEACEKVVEGIDEFINSGDECFLYDTFEASLDEISNELTKAEAKELLNRNDAAIKAIFDAYRDLKNALDSLKPTALTGNGYSKLDAMAKSYYYFRLKDAASSNIDAQKAGELLTSAFADAVELQVSLLAQDDTLAQKYGTKDLAMDTMEENINELIETMGDAYPKLDDINYKFVEIPEALKSQLSAGAYLTPPVDDWSENTVLINSDMLKENNDTLLTLAHETFPGHMYQIVYQRSLDIGYIRRTMGLTAYYEGWSTNAEEYFAMNTISFDPLYCTLMDSDSKTSNILVPALISVMTYAMEYTYDEVLDYFDQFFGETADALVSELVKYVDMDPFYFLEYALGYAQLHELYSTAYEAMGEDYYYDFHKFYLDLGPSYYNLIEPRLNEWLNERKGE